MNSKWSSRKFIAFIISLIVLVLCGLFDIEVSMAIVSLYTIYCGSNVMQKKE